ncbi:hypothetical protein AB8B21_17165 [Tardiphaga sp. 866_E4_N2_1]
MSSDSQIWESVTSSAERKMASVGRATLGMPSSSDAFSKKAKERTDKPDA